MVRRKTLAASAAAAGLAIDEVARKLAAAREKLHAVRAKRPRPHLDDKVVAGERDGRRATSCLHASLAAKLGALEALLA